MMWRRDPRDSSPPGTSGRHRAGQVRPTTVHRRLWDGPARAQAERLAQAWPSWTVLYGVGSRHFYALAAWTTSEPLMIDATTAEELERRMYEAVMAVTARRETPLTAPAIPAASAPPIPPAPLAPQPPPNRRGDAPSPAPAAAPHPPPTGTRPKKPVRRCHLPRGRRRTHHRATRAGGDPGRTPARPSPGGGRGPLTPAGPHPRPGRCTPEHPADRPRRTRHALHAEILDRIRR